MKLSDLLKATKDLFKQEDTKLIKINTWDKEFPQLPVLVLGIEIRNFDLGVDESDDSALVNHKFKGNRKWYLIDHQTAGVGCHHHAIAGTVLQVNEKTLVKFNELHNAWYGTNVGCMGCSLSELNCYRHDLGYLFGADCNHSYRMFEEAIYPIDLEYINNLTTENISSDTKELDKFVEWRDGLDQLCGCCGRWKLWILANNSD